MFAVFLSISAALITQFTQKTHASTPSGTSSGGSSSGGSGAPRPAPTAATPPGATAPTFNCPSTSNPSASITPSSPAASDSAAGRQLQEISSSQQRLQDARNGTDNGSGVRQGGLVQQQAAAQNAVNTARQTLATASPNDRAAAQAALDTAQRTVTEINQQIAANDRQMSELDQQAAQNPEYRRQRLEERYTELRAANAAKNAELNTRNTACQTDQNCLNRDVLGRQVTANCQYQSFLDARRALELCQLTPNAPCTAENEAVSNASRPLNATIAELTRLEQEKNSRATFEVSRIFSPTDQPLQRRTFQEIANTVANWMITLVTSLAVTTLIIGGFMMIISGGDENRLEMGKTIFEYSLIGLLVTLMAYGIITFVQSLFYS